jgi:hypothetical protein
MAGVILVDPGAAVAVKNCCSIYLLFIPDLGFGVGPLGYTAGCQRSATKNYH